jgi:hypothetical protein
MRAQPASLESNAHHESQRSKRKSDEFRIAIQNAQAQAEELKNNLQDHDRTMIR